MIGTTSPIATAPVTHHTLFPNRRSITVSAGSPASSRPHVEVPVRRGHPQLSEEDLRHVGVVMLARVDDGYSVVGSQQGVEGLVQLLILAGENLIQSLDDLRKILLDGVP